MTLHLTAPRSHRDVPPRPRPAARTASGTGSDLARLEARVRHYLTSTPANLEPVRSDTAALRRAVEASSLRLRATLIAEVGEADGRRLHATLFSHQATKRER
jgi:hypothetical protein